MTDLETAFSPDGPLESAIPSFRPRPQQLEMARHIAEALRDNRVLVAEAGTGTGKTFAYLVPALLSGGKVILSTGTKTLQDQLFNRDLPTIRAALKVPVTIALLKGRANYVCPYHLERNARDGRFLTAQDAADLRAIARFAKITQSGDKAECSEVREDSPAWFAATSTRDNCLGQECPNVKECFVLAARRAAMDADVVVVNHHLFFADVMLRDEGMGELLPSCNAVIFDEAHQLPETASLFFGESVSTAQILELARDTRSETLAGARDCRDLIDATRALEKAARDFRLAFGSEPARLSAAQVAALPEFATSLDALNGEIDAFAAVLETQAERSEGLANCLRRTAEIGERLVRWRSPDAGEFIRWVEVFPQSAALNATPLHVSGVFRRQLESHPRAWIFTSATLAVGQNFTHYCNEMGLSWIDPPPVTAVWGSPFDYAKQALLYAPAGMPDPNHPEYAEAVARVALPLIRAARGRTFVLCTSLRAMKRIHGLISDGLGRAGEKLPLLLQGEGSRSELLDRFRRQGNAVLVASQSFWEGVDVPGDALSVVVIDKLPFAPPDDPVLAARVEHLQKSGHNPFMHYQLPRAVISMKQGAGRLIRSERDLGVLCICDPRMIDKQYGKIVWRSLPPMRRTRAETEAVAFLEQLPPPAGT
ncbi:ATP-dependent DNA helicase [Azoarcus sp. CIB]|uniref:ATP-dependent DNA helicase n=1 Tax=Aromatoleum sp. (strain CIB) TaxID=198107 RepID=UPI00067CD77C|nr:ATP-dependent DNA helicase [Azoarcus sp. CIB]AKU11755.1 ATP-dependent DNA helicase [Azoarcus sp. CIB]